jgi:hypothetical protein
MDNLRSFFFHSFAFSTGLLIYTIILYLGYIFFMADDTSNEEISSGQEAGSKEKITDMDDLECLEDA